MKKILLFLLFPVFVSAQVGTSFNGKLNIFSSTDLGGNMHQITGLFNDENGLYSSSDVEVGDFVYVSNGASCARLRVDVINSDIGGIINADVFDVDAVLAASPTGICAIMRETPTFDYPVYVAGISQSLLSCIQTHFAILVDNVTVSGSGGGTTAVTIVQNSHGFSPGSPIVFDGIWALPTNDTMIAVYVVVDSIHEDTFTAAASGTFDTDIADGFYYQNNGGYSATKDTIETPLFVVADGKMTVNPILGYDLLATEDLPQVYNINTLADTSSISSPNENSIALIGAAPYDSIAIYGDSWNLVIGGTTAWLKTELEAGTPVSIAADTTTFDITGLERARFIANRIGNYTYSSRMYNTNTPNAGMYVTSNRNGTVNRIEIDTFKTRLAAYSTTAQTELAFYQDSLTLKMTSDTPMVGQMLTVSSIAADGITANMKWEYDEADILDYEHKGIGVTAEAIRERHMIIEEPYIYTYRNVFRIEEDTLISIFDLATLGSGSTTSFRKNGNFLYLNTASYLKKCDVSNPANIVVVDSIAVPSSREVLMTIENDLLYSYDYSSTAPADDQIVIRNFDLEEVRRIPYPGNAVNGYINANSLCEIYDSLLIAASYIDTLLVTNLNTEITTKISFGLVDGAFIHKDLLYIGRATFGDTLDIYQLPSFTKIRTFVIPGDPLQSPTPRSIVVNYPYIFSTNNNWGSVNKLRVLKIVGDSTLTELPYIPLLGISGRRLAYSGNNLVVANRNSNTIERIQIGKHSKQLGIDAVSVKTKDLLADNVYIKGEEVFDVKKQLRNRDVTLDGKNNNSLTVKDVRKFSIASDSVTLKITSDTPSVGQALTVSSIASDGITANLKWEDLASALSRDLNTTPLVPSLTNYSIPFQLSNITDANYTVTGDTAFTVATAGVYEITFAGSFTMASGAALDIALDITKNGTGIGQNKGVYVNTTISPITITKIVSCAAGDVIKVRIASINLTGRSLNVDAGSNLTIKKLK